MSTVIAIDPGTNAIGWAVVFDGIVVNLGVVQPEGDDLALKVRSAVKRCWDALIAYHTPPDMVLVEMPQIYKGSERKESGNDLIHVSILAGAVLGAIITAEWLFVEGSAGPTSALPILELPHPRDWAGTVPYEIREHRLLASGAVHAHARKRLEDDVPPYLRHNAYDAACIALWGAKRLARR